MPLTRTILYESDLLRIRYVACHVHDRRPSPVERAEWDSIVLPLRGAFLRHTSPTREVLAEPNQAMFFAAGAMQRISHPVTDRDDCLALDLNVDVLRDVLIGAAAVDTLGEVATHAILPARVLASRGLLLRRMRRGFASGIEIEETALDIVQSALRQARAKTFVRHRVDTKARRREQTDITRIALLAEPERKWTLTTLAQRANTSAHHLARVFRAEVGLSIHAYQLRARLLRAIDLLLDTHLELAAIAHDLGFANHSHFTAVFRRMIGVAPSEFRARI